MNISFFLLFPLLGASLTFGYYRETGETQMHTYVFVKKRPTLQIRFENIVANMRKDKTLSELNDQERRQVMNYCKYRLGIETRLKTQDELESCKEL
jgi:hypothetical protein